MAEKDAETGEKICNPHVHIRDYHKGHYVGINLTTLTRASDKIIPKEKVSIHNSYLYEISSSYEGGILGYITAKDLKKFFPVSFKSLEEMAKSNGNGSMQFEENPLGNDIY